MVTAAHSGGYIASSSRGLGTERDIQPRAQYWPALSINYVHAPNLESGASYAMLRIGATG